MKISAIKKIGTDEYDVVLMNDECTEIMDTICTCEGYENANNIIEMINGGKMKWQR